MKRFCAMLLVFMLLAGSLFSYAEDLTIDEIDIVSDSKPLLDIDFLNSDELQDGNIEDWLNEALPIDLGEYDLTIDELQVQDGTEIEHITAVANNSDDIAIDETHFPDSLFRSYVLRVIDIDGNGYLSEEERKRVLSIDIGNNKITNLEGIEYFIELEELDCHNNNLKYLDVSMLADLIELECSYNYITDIKLNDSLENLSCFANEITELNVEKCTNLKRLECETNKLISLDVSRCTKLEYLSCGDNVIKTLKIGKNSHLSRIECAYNSLFSLDVSKCNHVTTIVCDYNKLSKIKLGTNSLLSVLMCSANRLSSIDISGCSMLKNTITPIIASSEYARDRSYDVVIWGDYWDAYLDADPDKCYIEIDPGTTLKSGKTVLYKKGSPKSIKFTRSSGTIKKGKYVNLGKYIKMSPTGVASVCKLSSSNKKVVRVDNSGYAYGLKKGTATVTVKTANGKKAKIKIKVK